MEEAEDTPHTRVTIELSDGAASDDEDDVDHVVDGSLSQAEEPEESAEAELGQFVSLACHIRTLFIKI